MPVAIPVSDSPRRLSQSSSLRVAKGKSWVSPSPTSATLKLKHTSSDLGLDCFRLLRDDGEDIWEALGNMTDFRLSLENDDEPPKHAIDTLGFSVCQENNSLEEEEQDELLMSTPRPFHKWMKTLHRRSHRPTLGGHATEQFPECSPTKGPFRSGGHRKSSSGSSFGFVTAVKSATVSLASASVKTRQRRHIARSSFRAGTDHSSRRSVSAQRMSEDSSFFDRSSYTDPAVTERLLQRRRILDELITTEESYIGDIRFLMNVRLVYCSVIITANIAKVYVTILASLPTSQHGLRASINQNLTDIIELHEEILGELQRVVPDSEYIEPEYVVAKPSPLPHKEHHRWHDLNSVPEDNRRRSWLHNAPGVIAEPGIAAEVAQIFGRKVRCKDP